jgi:hypothetical protein
LNTTLYSMLPFLVLELIAGRTIVETHSLMGNLATILEKAIFLVALALPVLLTAFGAGCWSWAPRPPCLPRRRPQAPPTANANGKPLFSENFRLVAAGL